MSALEELQNILWAQTQQMLEDTGLGNSQQQWEAHVKESGVGADVQGQDDRPNRTGNEMLATRNRIYAGDTGDIAQRDKSGNITGYRQRVKAGSLTPGLDRQAQMQADKRAGAPLETASRTPGLDALHEMKPWSPATENPAYSVSVSGGNFAPGQSGFRSLADKVLMTRLPIPKPLTGPLGTKSMDAANLAQNQRMVAPGGLLTPKLNRTETWQGPTSGVAYGKYKSKYGDITVNTPAARTKQLADNLFL